jgi:hypothetical protein
MNFRTLGVSLPIRALWTTRSNIGSRAHLAPLDDSISESLPTVI